MDFLVKYSSDGRITIPREIRQELNLKGGTDLSVRVEGDQIIVEKPSAQCIICGTDRVNKYLVGDKIVNICEECKNKIELSEAVDETY